MDIWDATVIWSNMFRHRMAVNDVLKRIYHTYHFRQYFSSNNRKNKNKNNFSAEFG